MLEPAVVAALVVLVAYGLKVLAAYVGIPLDETTLNTLAAAIVTYLLSLFGVEVVKRAVRGTKLRGLFKE